MLLEKEEDIDGGWETEKEDAFEERGQGGKPFFIYSFIYL